MFVSLRETRATLREKVPRFIEEWYRVITTIALIGYLGFLWFTNKPTLSFALVTFGYSIYVLIIYFTLKGRIAYSINRYRLIRVAFDIIFFLLIIAFSGGVRSPAFVLLIILAFFASYRYSPGRADLVAFGIALSYIFVCLLVNWEDGETPITEIILKACVLLFVCFSNRYSRLFLIQRMKDSSLISEAVPKPVEVDIPVFVQSVCNALCAQTCLIFGEKGGRYELETYAEYSKIKQGKPNCREEKGANISISEEFINRMKDKREHFRILSSRDKGGIFDKSVEEVAEDISLGEAGIESIIGSFFVYPPDGTKKAIFAINKLKFRRFSLKNGYSIQDFRQEDVYLLEFVIDKILSDILLHLQKIDADTYNAMVDEGVAEEICTFNKEYETTSINKVKREFFKLDESAIGKKCHLIYHKRTDPCEDCRSHEAFDTDEIVAWEKPYNHPVTGRWQVASIKAKRVLNRKGQYEVMETVHDVTEERKYAALTDFILGLQVDKPPVDEQKFATRATELFGELGFERARFYEYDLAKDRFVCLASYGSKDDLRFGDRQFFVLRSHDKVSRWTDLKIGLPVLIRLEKTKDDDTYVKGFGEYKIYYVDEFPYKERLKKEKVTEQLDLPIVFGGRMLGKISIDNYSEALDKEVFRFNKEDLLIARFCSRIIGYVWESIRKGQLDDYIEALEHEILEPLHIISGHADFVSKYFDVGGVSQERKKLKLGDIIQELELLDAVIRGPRIEGIRKEDYEMEEVDFFKEVVIKAIVHIRDYYAIKKHVDIQHSESCYIPKMRIDKTKFELVFYNLLINAVKYADNDSTVWVKTRREDGRCIVDIEDQGMDVPEGEEEKIFLKHYRCVEGTDRDPGGKGWGLFTARLIVENHGGKLYVSQKGNPTTFTIEMPRTICL